MNMLTYSPLTVLSDAIKWRTFLRISILLLVLISVLFFLDLGLNEKQFQIHRKNIQAQYAFQLERLVESSADKMIQISGAASLNDGLVEAIQSRQDYLIKEELETLDWHLQADAGLTITGLFDASGQAFNHAASKSHETHLQNVIRNESPAWQVDCSETCEIISYTPLLVEGSLLAVLVLAEPLSHVLLRFHHVANIDTGLLSELDANNTDQRGLGRWQRYLEAVTNPALSRSVLSQASQQFSLEELQQHPQTVDLNDHIYELSALPFNSSQLVVMTEASSDYSLLAQSKDSSVKLALLVLLIGEIAVFVFLWTPLSRLTFSERLLGLLAARRFDDIKLTLEKESPENQKLARAALEIESELIAMKRKIAEQASHIDSISNEVLADQSDSASLLDELKMPALILNENGQVLHMNHYLKVELGLPMASVVGHNINSLIVDADIAFNSRLTDISNGVLSEYFHTAKCKDDQGNSHTYRWRYSVLPIGYQIGRDTNQRLLMMGQPLSEPSQDDQRRWCQEHDLDTALLNSKGFLRCLNEILSEGEERKQKHLVLICFPANLLDPNCIDRLHFLRFVHDFLSTQDNDKVCLQSRLEDNEFALMIQDSDVETILVNLEKHIAQGLLNLVGPKRPLSYQLATYQLSTSDRYALDVLARVRERYRGKRV